MRSVGGIHAQPQPLPEYRNFRPGVKSKRNPSIGGSSLLRPNLVASPLAKPRLVHVVCRSGDRFPVAPFLLPAYGLRIVRWFFHLLAVCTLLLPSLHAQESTVPVNYAQIAEERLLWPAQVLLKQPATLSLERDGVTAGMIELPTGRLVDVVALTPEVIQIRFGSARGEVLPEHTDLLERVSGATIARQLQVARMALIEESYSIVAAHNPTPEPTPTPSALPFNSDPTLEDDSDDSWGFSPAANRTRPLARQNEFIEMSDEFEDPSSLEDWLNLSDEEGGHDHFSRVEIPRHDPGQLIITPKTSAWYQQYHGNLLYKEVRGDFLVITKLQAADKSGRYPPETWYSLGGLMVRAPAPEGPQNYVFIGVGTTDPEEGTQLEVKSVTNSGDPEQLTEESPPNLEIGIARLGDKFICLRREPGEAWRVAGLFERPDLPVTLQVGITAFGDWMAAKQTSPEVHNARGTRDGDPDLRVWFEYVRFRPPIPVLRNTVGLDEFKEYFTERRFQSRRASE